MKTLRIIDSAKSLVDDPKRFKELCFLQKGEEVVAYPTLKAKSADKIKSILLEIDDNTNGNKVNVNPATITYCPVENFNVAFLRAIKENHIQKYSKFAAVVAYKQGSKYVTNGEVMNEHRKTLNLPPFSSTMSAPQMNRLRIVNSAWDKVVKKQFDELRFVQIGDEVVVYPTMKDASAEEAEHILQEIADTKCQKHSYNIGLKTYTSELENDDFNHGFQIACTQQYCSRYISKYDDVMKLPQVIAARKLMDDCLPAKKARVDQGRTLEALWNELKGKQKFCSEEKGGLYGSMHSTFLSCPYWFNSKLGKPGRITQFNKWYFGGTGTPKFEEGKKTCVLLFPTKFAFNGALLKKGKEEIEKIIFDEKNWEESQSVEDDALGEIKLQSDAQIKSIEDYYKYLGVFK